MDGSLIEMLQALVFCVLLRHSTRRDVQHPFERIHIYERRAFFSSSFLFSRAHFSTSLFGIFIIIWKSLNLLHDNFGHCMRV